MKKQTQEHKEFLIQSRGFPAGYTSKESYEKSIQKKQLRNKTCIICESSFIGTEKDYCCSKECKQTYRREKTRQTCLERYGVDNPRKNDAVKDKGKQTCLERYGVDNPQKNTKIKEQTKQTCLKRYGNQCVLNSIDYSEKRKQTCLERYGVDNFFKRNDLIIESYRRKFGDNITNPQQVKEINEKTFQTRKNRYELTGAVRKESSNKTCLEKYGSEYFFASQQGKMSFENLRNNYGWSEEQIIQLRKQRCSSVPFGRASKESLKLFLPLYKWLRRNGVQRTDILFGVNGSKEFQLVTNDYLFSYDFTIKNLKIIIEFHGIKFHARDKDDILVRGKSEDIILRDEMKKNAAIENGFDVLIMWSDETDLLNSCKYFILKKLEN